MREKTFSVIIPTLNAQKTLPRCLEAISAALPGAEVIIVDAHSNDSTVDIATKKGAKVLLSERGRGGQLNLGAHHSTGEILLFLHSDTILPKDAATILQLYFTETKVHVGTFGLKFDYPHWLLGVYSRLSRLDSIWTRFGDQCIVVRKAFYNAIGRFPNSTLFEDVCFLREARKHTKIYSFPREVVTSADRFVRNGIFRQQVLNGWMFLRFLLGESPERLSQEYCRW